MAEPLSEEDLKELEAGLSADRKWIDDYAWTAGKGRRLLAEVHRLRTLETAVRKFLSLPNWRNRVGSWTDVQDALAALERAAADNDFVPSEDRV